MSYADKTHPHLQEHDAAMLAFIIERALHYRWSVSIHDGEAWTLRTNVAPEEIWAAAATTGSDTFQFADRRGNRMGSAWLIYGNGPGELAADYGFNSAYGEAVAFMRDLEAYAEQVAA